MQISDNQKYIACLLVGVLLTLGAWYLLSSGADSNNVDQRLSGLETRLSDIAEQQRATTSAIESAQGTAGNITDTAKSIDAGLDSAQETVDRGAAESESAGNAMRDAASTVESCQELIDSNREVIARSAERFKRIEQSNKIGTN